MNGAKHGLTPKYPGPLYDTIIEPFAGSAAYSTLWTHAPHVERIIIVERDAALCEVWRSLQTMTVDDLVTIGRELDNERTTQPILASMAGGTGMPAVFDGRSLKITPRMRKDWLYVRRRVARALPHVKRWEIIEGDYTDAPDIEATHFIDPPYQTHDSMAGDGYRHGQDAIDFDALADWCRARRGQVIVCEQHPAAWLPFQPLVYQNNGVASSTAQSRRLEVVWSKVDDRGRLDPRWKDADVTG